MRFMVLVKATTDSEAGVLPTADEFATMRAYQEALEAAGILRGVEGLQSSAKGARLIVEHGERMIVDGPFAETKELVAGYFLWEVASREEAIAWLKRFPTYGADWIVELRQVFEPSDFGEALTREVHAKEAALRAERAAAK